MKVPLLNLSFQHDPIREELDCAIKKVLDSNEFILGEEVDRFEKNISEYFGNGSHAIGVSSGTDALLMALSTRKRYDGVKQAVIVPSLTFASTVEIVIRNNMFPFFVDIEYSTFGIDYLQLEDALFTIRSKYLQPAVVIPVHLYGQSADMAAIMEMLYTAEFEAHNVGLFGDRPIDSICIIEDAAQSFGAEIKINEETKKVGTIGDIGCFSFFPSKNLSCIGDGGLLLTKDERIADELRSIRLHGRTKNHKYEYERIGGNFRLDAVQAAILDIKLKYLDEFNEVRRKSAQFYTELIESAGLIDGNKVEVPEEFHKILALSNFENVPRNHHTYNQYSILVPAKDRDNLISYLLDHKIQTAIYYPIPLHKQKIFREYSLNPDASLPVTEDVCSRVISLPIFPGISTYEQEEVIDTIKKFFK